MIEPSRRMAKAPALVAAAVAAAACVGTFSPTPVEAQRRNAATFSWDGALDAGQTLEIKGVNGSINAIATSSPTARVEAARSGRRNDPAEVQIEVVEHAQGVTICAIYPSSGLRSNECLPGDEGRISARNTDVQVDFTVEVPATAILRARTVNGSIEAQGLAGPVEANSTNGNVRVEGGERVVARTTNGSIDILSAGGAEATTTNGQIRARLGSLAGDGPLDFSTTNGSIVLEVPSDSNFDIDARTGNGRIDTDLPITVQGSISRRSLNGSIGAGGRDVRLRTINGRISIESGV
jgi:Putative adhesin